MDSSISISESILFETSEEPIIEFTLRNSLMNFQMKVLNLGCIITEVLTTDKDNKLRDVILGYQDKKDYLKNPMYLNAVVGPVCGRISSGSFFLKNKKYNLDINNGENHLHGGEAGLSHKIWKARSLPMGVEFTYTSEHMEGGYPGNVEYKVRYLLIKECKGYVTQFEAKSDQTTIINLNTHEYWNLSGGSEKSIFNSHRLQIFSRFFLEMNQEVLPSGNILKCSDWPAFDFQNPKRLAEQRKLEDPHWKNMKGFDHSFVLEKPQLIENLGLPALKKFSNPKEVRYQ